MLCGRGEEAFHQAHRHRGRACPFPGVSSFPGPAPKETERGQAAHTPGHGPRTPCWCEAEDGRAPGRCMRRGVSPGSAAPTPAVWGGHPGALPREVGLRVLRSAAAVPRRPVCDSTAPQPPAAGGPAGAGAAGAVARAGRRGRFFVDFLPLSPARGPARRACRASQETVRAVREGEGRTGRAVHLGTQPGGCGCPRARVGRRACRACLLGLRLLSSRVVSCFARFPDRCRSQEGRGEC